MIGIVGPQDSVGSVLQVAASIDLDIPLKPRVYQHIDEAGVAARAITAGCDYLLFTGQAAYAIARSGDNVTVPVDYVDYTAADIARALFIVARDHAGRIPQLSIDGFDAGLIRTTCEDLGLTYPEETLELSEDAFLDEAALQRVITFHRNARSEGRAMVALTCLGAVATALQADHVPVYRITHTYSAIRSALERARDSVRLTRSRETQIVVGMLRFPEEEAAPQRDRDRDIERLAALLRGTFAKLDETTYSIHSTLGPLDDVLRPGEKGRSALRRLQRAHAVAGFGMGTTAAAAEDNAVRAMRLSSRPSEGIYLVRSDGTARHLLDGTALALREVGHELRHVARELGIGTVSLRRLIGALSRLDPAQVAVRDVANAYGVSPRTARRLLAALRDRGLAVEAGVEMGPGPGRPQMLYKLEIGALLSLVETSRGNRPHPGQPRADAVAPPSLRSTAGATKTNEVF